MIILVNQKGVIPILILVILVVLIGGYLVYQKQLKSTPSPSPTTDIKLDLSGKFKVYTNHIDKYSFNFPTDWNLKEEHPADIRISDDPRHYSQDWLTVYLYPQSEEGKEYKSYMAITVSKANPRHLEEISKASKEFAQDYQSSPKKLTVSDQKAFQSNERGGIAVQAGIVTQFRYGIDQYQVDFYEGDKDNGFIDENIDIYNQLLSSFKFIDPPSTAVSSDLKTYEFKDLGISFQIPGDWVAEKYKTENLMVFDENDREIITMQTRDPGSEVNCRKDPNKIKSYPLGDKQINLDLSYECLFSEIIKVRSSTGKVFYFNFRFVNIDQTDKEKDLQFLKTIKGLEVIQ